MLSKSRPSAHESTPTDFSVYVYLFTPAIDWIVQCMAYKVNEQALVDILNYVKQCNSAPLLNAIISSFPPQYLASRCVCPVIAAP